MQYPRHTATRRAVAAALGIALILASAGLAARHHNRSSGAAAGEFDYYLLSLSWSPAYCLDSPGAAECNGARRFGFIVHGLWPQGERYSPERCDQRRPVPEEVVDGIADLMPSRSLVHHEWSAHGTCSGLEPREFFQLVRRARAEVVIPDELANPGAAITESTDSLLAAFRRANPGLPAGSLLVTCSRQDVPRLREVRVCMDRDLTPRPCGGSALRGACHADRLVVPPVR